MWFNLQVLSTGKAPSGITLTVASVTHGAFRKGPCHVVHSGMGSLNLARVDPQLPDLMHPNHQSMWDAEERAGWGKQHVGSADLLRAGPSGAGTADENLRSGSSLFDLLLKTPGLSGNAISSHLLFLKQVGIGP